jgi:hypothetical protein
MVENYSSNVRNPFSNEEIVVTTKNCVLHIYDITSKEVRGYFQSQNPITWINFSPFDSNQIAYKEEEKDMSNLNIYLKDTGQTLNICRLPLEVVQWNNKTPSQIIAGDSSGIIHVFSFVITSGKIKITKKKIENLIEGPKETLAVVDLKMDPHSDSYVLVAFKSGKLICLKLGKLVLLDISTGKIVNTFSKQSGKVRLIQWIPHISV